MCARASARERTYKKYVKSLLVALNGATESLNFERTTRSGTVSSATQKLKIRECDTVLHKTAARVLVNCAEIEQLTSVWCVKAQ